MLETDPDSIHKLVEFMNQAASPIDCLRSLGLDTHPDITDSSSISHKQAGNIIYHMSVNSQFKDTTETKAAIKRAAKRDEAARKSLGDATSSPGLN
jgi:hypothetical protein